MLFAKAAPILLRVAVLIFPNLVSLDVQGPIEFLGFVDPKHPAAGNLPIQPKYQLEFHYVAPTFASVKPVAGPSIVPNTTYQLALWRKQQFDVVFVPGGLLHYYSIRPAFFEFIVHVKQITGPGSRPNNVPPIVRDFVKAQAPGIWRNPNGFFVSTCTGSWILADCGILNGQNATSNKNAFRTIVVRNPTISRDALSRDVAI